MYWNQMSNIEHIITIVSYCVFAWICLNTVGHLISRKRLKVAKSVNAAYWQGYDRARADVSKLHETLLNQHPSKYNL